MRSARGVGRALLLGATLLAAGPTLAHDFGITDVLVVFRIDGTYSVEVRADLDALALGVSPGIDSSEIAAELRALSPAELAARAEALEDTLVRRLRIRFDGVKQRPAVDFPEWDTPLGDASEVPSVLGTTARLVGRVPDGAREFTFGASRTFDVVSLTILDQATAAGSRFLLSTAEDSPPWVLGAAPLEAGRLEVAARYLILGFEHILPKGVDHILFVLGLFLLSERWRPLLWQVSAFTLAHTLTLALSMYGIVSLPSRVVEPLIALSIAYVAIENLITRKMTPWRPAVVFGFGLLHGLGFAGVLRGLGLPDGQFLTALLSFNVGVECGQLAVIGLAVLAVGWFRARRWYRPAIIVPASALIALIGLYWSVERVLG